ncbi:prolipoprotein diacylglyceryl transferase [Anderseniella sp. Alg231-50]|uniref:prolipoprotein diacylglyceryl transferase n=1 Tax=Anderseniella sp. Alg231-50 TaxID=1922226 RepID=UPI000D559902
MPTLFAIPFPVIDPVALSLGPLEIRWYALAYVVGLMGAIWYAKRLVSNEALWPGAKPHTSPAQLDDLLLWSTLGVLLGGRLGYVLFYNPAYFVQNPSEILQMWNGGMSFHGGFLGVVVACYFYGRRHGIGMWQLLDLGAASVPIGLFLGRLANFINAELYGKVTDVPWAMVFPGGGPDPRHPSQLYEAGLEGILLFLAVRVATHRMKCLPRAGVASGVFATGYAASRIIVEFAREPDAHIGYLTGGWLTMGMVLSLPLLGVGIWLLARSRPSKSGSTA